VREEELERQFEAILEGFTFSQEASEWMRTALKQSAGEKRAFYDRSIERLNAQAAKLRNRLDQIYLDKLDGETDEGSYGIHVAAWKKELTQVRNRIEKHESANHTYIDQGIRLLELARNGVEFYRTHDQEERAILLRFILQGSTLQDGKVIPTFNPPFDIIHDLAEDARKAERNGGGAAKPLDSQSTKKQAASPETTCLILLPR